MHSSSLRVSAALGLLALLPLAPGDRRTGRKPASGFAPLAPDLATARIVAREGMVAAASAETGYREIFTVVE